MATVQTIIDGARNLVIKVTGTAAESAVNIVDVSALNIPCDSVSLERVTYGLKPSEHFQILWDATSDVTAIDIWGGSDSSMCFCTPIPNNAGAGKTGDVLLTGGTASTNYTLYLEFLKIGVHHA